MIDTIWLLRRKVAVFLMHWRNFIYGLCLRALSPIGHPTFLIYFLVSIVFLGGIGIWLPPLLQHKSFDPADFDTASIATYFLALVGSTFFTMFLDVRLRDDKNKAVFSVLWAVAMIALLMGFVALAAPSGKASWWGLFLAWVLWWLANAYKEELRDSPVSAGASTGGDASQDMAGSLDGIKS